MEDERTKLNRLTIKQVTFDPGSVVDDAGIVFHYDNRIFRAINSRYAGIYKDLIASRKLIPAFNAGLINTWIPEIGLEGYELVLEHEKIPILSSWQEWSTEMIKESTLVIAKVNYELTKIGFVLKDTQPGNVQFNKGQAIWIDFGSIVPLDKGNYFRTNEFRINNLFPLWLISKGKLLLGKKIYDEVGNGYLKSLTQKTPIKFFPLFYYFAFRNKSSLSSKLNKLINRIESLQIDDSDGKWSGYNQGGRPDVNDKDKFSEKHLAVLNAFEKIEPGSILDMAGNKGWYSELAVSLGHTSICFDLDDKSINHLYRRVKKMKLPILPLMLDFLYPTPPYSIALGKADSFIRLKSDTVLALAILHHLVFFSKIRFDTFADIISRYSRRYAIIEFVPDDDIYVKKWMNDNYSWYTIENLIEALSAHFSTIDTINSHPFPRKLLICSK